MRPYYERGGITIYHGDCRVVLPTLEAGSVDLVLTDPPSSISVAGAAHVNRPGKGVRRLDFFVGDDDWRVMTDSVVNALRQMLGLLRSTASIYIWVGHRQFGPVVQELECCGWRTQFLVWAKEVPPPAAPGSGWPSGAELCVYAYRPGRMWAYRGSDTPRSNVLVSDSYRFGQPGKVNHPTQKPLGVIVPLILASTQAGDLIVDAYAGSGTTLVAAKALNRRAIGIEIEERYAEIAANRLMQDVLPLSSPPLEVPSAAEAE